jgi:hypothetical protein
MGYVGRLDGLADEMRVIVYESHIVDVLFAEWRVVVDELAGGE